MPVLRKARYDGQQMCKDQLPVEGKGAEVVGFRAIARGPNTPYTYLMTRMKSLVYFAFDWVWRENDEGQLE